MPTQHQPNAAMQETTPAPSTAPEVPKPTAPSNFWDYLMFATPVFLLFLGILVLACGIAGKAPVIYFQEPKCVFGICIDLPAPNRR